jgi:hypothetical protein
MQARDSLCTWKFYYRNIMNKWWVGVSNFKIWNFQSTLTLVSVQQNSSGVESALSCLSFTISGYDFTELCACFMSPKIMVSAGTHTRPAAQHFEKHSTFLYKSSFCAQISLDYFPRGLARSVTFHNTIKQILRLKNTAFSIPQKKGKLKDWVSFHFLFIWNF